MTALQRRSPHRAGSELMRQRGCPHLTPADSRAQWLDGKPIGVLLRHHADYVDTVLLAICEGEPISLAGRTALAYTADRLREIAEVIG